MPYQAAPWPHLAYHRSMADEEAKKESPVEAQPTNAPPSGGRSNIESNTPPGNKSQESKQSSAEEEQHPDGSFRSLRKLMKRLNPTPLPELLFTSLVAIAVATIAGVLAPWLLGAFGSGGVDATQQIYFQPWDTSGSANISPQLHIASRVSGYCWERSVAANRPDAYRCFHESTILDPCISNPYEGALSKQVVCPYPGTQSVTLISLTKPLPSSPLKYKGAPYPWLIILTDGDRCTIFNGASILSAGLPEDYLCSNGGLYGNVDRSSQLWTIVRLQTGSSEMIPASIAAAYF